MKKRNMKKYMAYIMTAILAVQVHTISYASTEECLAVQPMENVHVFQNSNASGGKASPRGVIFSSAELNITDEGGGTIGVYADVLCHEAAERIKMNLVLEIWNNQDETWETVDSYDFEWNADDYPGEELTMAVVEMNIPGVERGRDYHMRGIFSAKDLDSSIQEVRSINTGIPLFVE